MRTRRCKTWKLQFRNCGDRSRAGRTASVERNRESGHRKPMPGGTTRHCQSSLPALGGLFIVISKRDPAPSFNRIIHIDS
jgi:hypothetical protein